MRRTPRRDWPVEGADCQRCRSLFPIQAGHGSRPCWYCLRRKVLPIFQGLPSATASLSWFSLPSLLFPLFLRGLSSHQASFAPRASWRHPRGRDLWPISTRPASLPSPVDTPDEVWVGRAVDLFHACNSPPNKRSSSASPSRPDYPNLSTRAQSSGPWDIISSLQPIVYHATRQRSLAFIPAVRLCFSTIPCEWHDAGTRAETETESFFSKSQVSTVFPSTATRLKGARCGVHLVGACLTRCISKGAY